MAFFSNHKIFAEKHRMNVSNAFASPIHVFD